jgi:hypothetical protein
VTGAAGYWFPAILPAGTGGRRQGHDRGPLRPEPCPRGNSHVDGIDKGKSAAFAWWHFHGLFGNRWSWAAIALSLAVQLPVRRVTQPRRTPDA